MKKAKIIYISDTHGYLFPTDYITKDVKPTGLMNCATKFIKDENSLIIDGGDTLQGSPFAYYYSKHEGSKIVAEFMNDIKLDYYTFGNHDFNYGYDYLKTYMDICNAKVICSNIRDLTGKIKIEPYRIIELPSKIKLGIVGVTTDFINIWEKKENIENFEVTDTFEAAKKYLEEIRGKCDIKICLYHGGIEENIITHELLAFTKENIAAKIARELDFDLMLTGHQHMPLADTVLYNSHIVQTPSYAKAFVEVDILLDDEKGILEINSKLVDAGDKSREDLKIKFDKYDKIVQTWLDTPITELEADLKVEDKIDMAINGSKLADLINKIQLFYSGADISVTSFANEVSGFNKDVTVRDVMMTYRFPNTLAILEIDGKILREALEQNYTYISKDENGKYEVNKKFLKPKVEHYNFDFFYGIDFEVDLTKDEYLRIGKITFKGKEVKDSDKFKIVMNDYRSTGAGNFHMYSKLEKVSEVLREVSELIIEYLETENRKKGGN